MGHASKIEWTHHTFNPWWGCTKVSAACKHCYAQAFDRRTGGAHWGAKAPRRFFTDRHWSEPLRWHQAAKRRGERQRVFCASMADVFEPRAELNAARERLWDLVEQTPNLDWLLLTKRPAAIASLAPWSDSWPDNVWLGVTVESDKWYSRIDRLLRYPARVRFLSCEPLLSDLDLSHYLPELDWVIAGGESGPKARPTQPEWVRSLRDQCADANISFHFKQWGHWAPDPSGDLIALGKKRAGRLLDSRTWDAVPHYIG